MDIKILNQYTQVWEVDDHVQKDVFRTHETLEQLKERLDLDGYVVDGEWKYDGVITCVYGVIADSMNDINRVQEFNEKKHDVHFGKKGYHTLEEIEQADLVWIQGYGIVDESNITDFKTKFEDASQKK